MNYMFSLTSSEKSEYRHVHPVSLSACSWNHVYFWERRCSHHVHLGPQRAAEHPGRPPGRGLQQPAEGRHLGASGEHPWARRLSSAAHCKDGKHNLVFHFIWDSSQAIVYRKVNINLKLPLPSFILVLILIMLCSAMHQGEHELLNKYKSSVGNQDSVREAANWNSAN